MGRSLRIFLLIGAFLAFYVVLKNIRKSKMLISDCLGWFFLGFLAILLAVFPEISFFFSKLIGVESPANLIYLILISVLFLLSFKQAIRISELEIKIKDLTQNITIDRRKNDVSSK